MAVTHNLTRDEAARRSRLLRVESYRVWLDLTGGETFTSITEVRFSCAEPDASTVVEIAAERIVSATLNGDALDASGFSPADGLAVPGLAADNVLRIEAECAFGRDGEGLHRLTDPADGQSYLYTHFEANNAQKMFACFDQPDLKADFDLRVRVPAAWRVVSNMPAAESTVDGEFAEVRFDTLPRTSTYLTALCAGPLHRVTETHDGIELGMYCRESMRDHLDADAVFAVTRQLLDHYHRHFGVRYPLPKYDQVAMPEYNAGATENFGCVVFNENLFVFRSRPSETALERRAYVMAHEMAHMWFGDLVTPRWWDETWLKESFASWAGLWALAESTAFTDAWTSFAIGEKVHGYLSDRLSTTHPIRVDAPDVKIGRSNFDAITYCKGAGVLKQLVALVGIEAFCRGLRAYFDKHQWGVATFDDLRAALETASGRDLSAWSGQWLDTSGYNTIRPELSVSDGVISSFVVRQDAAVGDEVRRDHRIAIGLYDLDGTVLRQRERVEVDVVGDATEVAALAGRPRPDLLLLNDDDLSYVGIDLDPVSLATSREHLAGLETPLARALCWSAAWSQTTETGTVSASAFVSMLGAAMPAERHPAVTGLLDQLVPTILLPRYFTPADLTNALGVLAAASLRGLDGSEAGGGAQRSWAKRFIAFARTDDDTQRVRGWLNGRDVPNGLAVDEDLRWMMLRSLAASGVATSKEIAAQLARDDTMSGQKHALSARASRPDAASKQESWSWLTNPNLSNSDQSAILSGFLGLGQDRALRPYVEPMLDLLGVLWEHGSHDRAAMLASATSRLPTNVTTLAALEEWLSEAKRPPVLRRLVTEARDGIALALRVR
ncbi:MAG TPA: aminopeptidase N [Stackebrandtia sp.]|jgi:aminopeptidase N|uniref:aminopeptidase N n=1 Tax=Stackebrandtia sp. TaxID=2023065 RepID=UPI002D4B6685|nr:aminopeptidase N [Stackebrandtia sp.]HZE41921.1 aminopeptidase N [Stackebrandtia sp.]